jgi:glutamyl-tRNA synthetase
MSSIYSNNRELIDEETDRAFFVREDGPDVAGAVRMAVSGGPDAGEPLVHPNHEDRGRRHVPVDDAVLLEAGDVPTAGERVWLKGYGCVRSEGDELVVTGDDLDVVREGGVQVVHWVPADGPRLRLRTVDGHVTGVVEPGVTDYEESVLLQFERVGFARLDDLTTDPAVAYYTHH